MKHSGIILYFTIITTLCLFIRYTGLCSSPLSCVSFSPTNNFNRIAVRRALSTHITEHVKEQVKVFHGMKHSPQEHAYRREELVKSGINGDDAEDELMYHIDYHGVTTHPSPTPKHGKP
ncbi:hypothetical protein BVRB_8g190110 [Beta vulgaris subsp. vulgaris]|nr:hypothetical protein BVRB_8g190110 [Beta vulgaris subsp. vulgaris]